MGDLIPTELLTEGCFGPWDGQDRFYSRKLAVSVPASYDGVLYWACPDCRHVWHRWSPGSAQYRLTEAIWAAGGPLA